MKKYFFIVLAGLLVIPGASALAADPNNIIIPTLVSTSATKATSTVASQGDIGTFKITFDVNASPRNQYIDKSCRGVGTDVPGQGVEYYVVSGSENYYSSSSCTLTSSQTNSLDTSSGFFIATSTSRRFTLIVTSVAKAIHTTNMSLVSINHGLSSGNTNDDYRIVDNTFKTDSLTLAGPATISNVKINNTSTGSPTTWVQATSKPVSWITSERTAGNIPTVDVLVCYLRTGLSDACFYAHQNIANTGYVANVRVGTNVPLNSTAYVKVRKAGTDTISAKSASFKVVSSATIGGILLKAVSGSANRIYNNSDTSSDDQGEYTIEFDVTALEDTAFIALVGAISTSTNPSLAGVYAHVENSSNIMVAGTTTITIERIRGGAINGNYVRIDAGKTATLRARILHDAAATGIYRAQIRAVNFNDTQAVGDTQQLALPEADFQSPSVQVLTQEGSNTNQLATVLASIEGLLKSIKEMLGSSR